MKALNSPCGHVRLNWALFAVWVGLGILTILFWLDSIRWISFMSIYAIIVGHWTAAMASMAEEKAAD